MKSAPLIFALFLSATTPVLAGPSSLPQMVVPPSFNTADKARIASATAYLQGLATAQGRFQQADYRGKITIGSYVLARPGRMRFDYDAPYQLTIVSDGKTVHVANPRLGTLDHYPLSETPLSLFLSKSIRFDQGVISTRVATTSDGFQLTARDRRAAVEGNLVLDFAQSGTETIRLRGWSVTDAQGHATRINLVSLSPATSLSSTQFSVKSPAN